MQGFANRDALVTTISSRKATFYSRSRSKLWTKGETSSNFINVCDIFLDCDRDSVSLRSFRGARFSLLPNSEFSWSFFFLQIIYLGKPDGPTCHTGSETCYFSSVSQELESSDQVWFSDVPAPGSLSIPCQYSDYVYGYRLKEMNWPNRPYTRWSP